jgi:HPr kinase/phosphorylase
MKPFLLVKDIIETNRKKQDYLKLRLLTGSVGLDRKIFQLDLNRPGLALSGHFKNFGSDRVQIFGRGECAFLSSLDKKTLAVALERMFAYKMNLCVFTHGIQPPKIFVELARQYSTPVAVSQHATSAFIILLNELLEHWLAPSANQHGVLLEVFGVGVFIIGKSGIGKSETALELIKRGHRFVADDVVKVRKVMGTTLIGSSHDLLRHKMEIRGLGIVDIERVYGIGAIKQSKRIDLVIRLADWDNMKGCDRLGIQRSMFRILGVKIPYIILPVKAGRNIPVIIETATLDMMLKESGYNASYELTEKVKKNLKNAKVCP